MAEVDKTGLDYLCTGPGDIYMPPKGGLSVCIKPDGTILICDSKTNHCTLVPPFRHGADSPQSAEAVITMQLVKLVKELSERVKRLESKASASKKNVR